jgi:vacuolar iron transporter family protein
LQAAAVSAASFAAGAGLPLAVVALAPPPHLLAAVSAAASIALAVLGGLAARIGGAEVAPGVARVVAWSALAMAVTYGIGALVGQAI